MALWFSLDTPARRCRVLLAFFCIGVAAAPFVGRIAGVGIFFWLFLLGLCVFFAKYSRKKSFAFTAGAVSFLGVVRFLLVSVPTLPADLPKVSRIEGVVVSDVDRRQDEQSVTLGQVTLDNCPWDGRIRFSVPLYPALFFEDRVSLACALQRPSPINGFRYDTYLASQNITATCSFPSALAVTPPPTPSIARQVLQLKSRVLSRLPLVLTEPHASFVSGLLFGGSFAISPELKDAFSLAGVSHILAASGFNVSLVTFVFLGIVTRRIGRKWGGFATVLLLTVYVFLAGGTSSILRAALMASILLAGLWVQRKADQGNMLLLAASVLLMWNPLLLLGDPGFQLSFGATAALLLVAPAWKKAFAFLPESFGIRETCVGSLAIQAVTLPIVLWHFGSISVISPLANLCILPFIPLLFWSGFATVVVGGLSLTLGRLGAVVPWLLSTVVLRLVQIFSTIPPVALPPVASKGVALMLSFCFLAWVLWHFKHRVRDPQNGRLALPVE